VGEKVIERLKTVFGDRIVTTSCFRGQHTARVNPADWLPVATFLRDDPGTAMELLVDLTAVDYLPRDPQKPRFEVVLIARSISQNHLVRVATDVADGGQLDSLVPVWRAADWAEREVYDMFGIGFRGHPNLRRILLYDQFEGHPLRKDYPIAQTQPIVPYRNVEGTEKLPPFGDQEGKPWSRIDWPERVSGQSYATSPALSLQQAERPVLSVEPETQPE
jgi:NADH-quinone oxidoreductase subunit C